MTIPAPLSLATHVDGLTWEDIRITLRSCNTREIVKLVDVK